MENECKEEVFLKLGSTNIAIIPTMVKAIKASAREKPFFSQILLTIKNLIYLKLQLHYFSIHVINTQFHKKITHLYSRKAKLLQ